MAKLLSKIPLWLKIVFLVLIIVVTIGIYGVIRYSVEMGKMRPIDTQEIIGGIYVVRTRHVNFYAIKSGDEYILFDTGFNKDQAIAQLHKLNISPDDVAAVFLTHAHGDHTGSLAIYKNADIYIYGTQTRIIKNVECQPLDDGQEVTVAGRVIKGILTKGHTDNSMSFLVDAVYLFAGDNLSLKNGKVQLFNSFLFFFNKDNKQQAASLKELAQIDSTTHIFSAHYGYCDNAGFAFADWK